MDKRQQNEIAMLTAVREYTTKHKDVWQATKAYGDGVSELGQWLGVIDTIIGKQEAPTTGVTVDKDRLRDDLEDQIFEIGESIGAYATKQNNGVLEAIVDFSRSSLDVLGADRLEDVGNRVKLAATENAVALADYGITAEEIAELGGLLAQFAGTKTAPRITINERVAQTATLPEAIRAARNLLRDQLDRMTNKFRRKNPEYVAGYRSARVIIDRRAQSAPDKPNPDTVPATPAL